MKREASRLALLAVLPVALLGIAPAQAATQISSCPVTITQPGVYQVTQDLGPCAGTAITILASKVDLHLNGHTISGSGGGPGIYVEGASNVTVRNGTVQGFVAGVELRQAVDCKVTDVTARQNSWSGIVAQEETRGLTMSGCTATQNTDHGILFHFSSQSNTATRNTANGNGTDGITLAGTSANSVMNNTANGNGGTGIVLSETSANSVAQNTANQNGYAGFILGGGSSANTVANNTASDNACVGMHLSGVNGNTVERNTTDRNGCVGIAVHENSSTNILGRNSATGNQAHGISVQGSQNTLQDNTVSGNVTGIFLGDGPTSGNILQGNTANQNVRGILLEAGAAGNSVHGNTAQNNSDWDLGDQNPCCISNDWSNNRFVTDNVTGASDRGPVGGCIR
jgi:parallel beta-helix repeat protein